MFTWLAGIVGDRLAKTVFFGGIAILALILVFILGRCTGDDDGNAVAEQAAQGNRSGEAIANAARNAVQTITEGVATEQAIDAAVAEATKGINDAQTVDAIHAVVVDSVCQSPAHRNDPACRVR